jgi:hypothetical protein
MTRYVSQNCFGGMMVAWEYDHCSGNAKSTSNAKWIFTTTKHIALLIPLGLKIYTTISILYHFDQLFTGCDAWHREHYQTVFTSQILGQNGPKLHKNRHRQVFMAACDPWWNTWSVQFKVICDPWLNTWSKWYSMRLFFIQRKTIQDSESLKKIYKGCETV